MSIFDELLVEDTKTTAKSKVATPTPTPAPTPTSTGRSSVFDSLLETETPVKTPKTVATYVPPKVEDTSSFSNFLTNTKRIGSSFVADAMTTFSGLAGIPRNTAIYGTKAIKSFGEGVQKALDNPRTLSDPEWGMSRKEEARVTPTTQFYQDVIDELGKGKVDQSNWDTKIQTKAKELGDRLQVSQGVDPNNRTFAQNLAGGFGSMTGFFVPSFGLAKAGSLLVKSQKAAQMYKSVGGVSMVLNESFMEGDQVFQEVYSQTGNVQEAQQKADNTVASNVILIGITNKYSKYFENTAPGFRNLVKSALTTAISEGPIQEGGQQVISNLNTGRPIFEGVTESAIIGSIVGGITHVATRNLAPKSIKPEAEAVVIPNRVGGDDGATGAGAGGGEPPKGSSGEKPEENPMEKLKEKIFEENKGNPVVDEYAKNDAIFTDVIDYINNTKEVETPEEIIQKLIDSGMDSETATQMMNESVLQDIRDSTEDLTPEGLQADIDAFMSSAMGTEEDTTGQEMTPAPTVIVEETERETRRPQQDQVSQPTKKVTDTLKDTSGDIKYDMTPTVEPAEFSDTNTVFTKGDYGVNTEGKLVEIVSGNDTATEQEKLIGNEGYLRTREVGTKEDYIDYANQLRKATPEEIDLANQYELENPPVANPRRSLSEKEKKQREADITIRISSFSPTEKAEVEKYHSLFTKMFESYDAIAEKNPENMVADNQEMAMEELLKSEDLTEKQQKFIMDTISSMGEGYVENFEKFAKYMADNELLDIILSRLPATGKAKKTTQKEKVKEVLGKKEKATIKEIADATGILEPNVRRILGVGAKEGDFERVAEGVYRITDSKGNEIAVIIPGDAITTLPQLAKDGFKADMVFLDIPYETAGQKGGKEGEASFRRLADYNLISPKDFAIVVKAVEDIVRTDNTPVVYMYAKGKTSSKEMQEYTDILANSSFKVIAQGDYYKVNKDGEVLNLPMRTMESGEKMPPEGILVFSKSGEVREEINNADLQFKLRRPTGYKTEKPAEMIAKLIEMTTEEGDVVLDPFAGSGVTGAEAVKQGRKAVLIEKNKEVAKDITTPRVEGAVPEVKDVFLKEEYTSNEEPTGENQSVSRELFGKEVTKYIQAINDKLGWTVDSKDATKAGKVSFKNVFNNDYVSAILWKTPEVGIYISVNSHGWDTAETGTIMYRVTKPEIKYTGMSNNYSSVTTSSGDFADIINELVTREENNMVDNVDESSTIKDNEQGTEPKTISDISEVPTTDDMERRGEVTGEVSRYDRATMFAQSGNGLGTAGANGLTKKQRQLINEEVEAILEDKNYSTSPDDYSLNDLDLMAAYSGAGGKESVGGEGAGLLNEYYTPRPVVIQMWNILERLMPNVETAFEPSAGIGKIINDAPASVQVDGAEISKVSGTIAQLLNPQSNITIGDFQELFFDRATNKQKEIKQYDAVIGNPPFGDRAGFLKGKGEESGINRQEEYFIKRGLDMTKEGGYLVYVVNSSFLKTSFSKGKDRISDIGELVLAYRLPEKSFEDTSIGTDIVVFKKDSMTGLPSSQRDRMSMDRQMKITGDNYFQGVTESANILGSTEVRKNRFGQTETYVKGDLNTAVERLSNLLPEPVVEEYIPPVQKTVKLSELAGIMGIPFTEITAEPVSDLDNALNNGSKVIEQEGDMTVVENPASYSATGKVTYTRFKNEEVDQTSGDKETLVVNKETKQKKATKEEIDHLLGKDKKKAVKKSTEKDSFSVQPKKNWEELVAPVTNISNKKNATQVETNMLRRIDRDLAIPTPSQDEMKYLNLEDGKYYPDPIYFAGEVYQKLEQLKKDKKTIIENFGQAQYDKQEKGLNSVIPAPYAIGDITFDPIDRHIAQIKAKGMKWGEEVDTTVLGLFNDYVRQNDVALSPRVTKYDISNYVNGHNAAKGTKPIMGFIKNDSKRLFNHFLKHELPADLQKSIAERYNKEKNGYVKPDYSQLPIEVKNMSKTFKKDENGVPLEFKMSQTQKNGVSFLVNKGSGALAWGVGVGKTLGLAISTKANMDKGWTKRPIFIVPTPTIQGTWINTFQEMFPDLKINNFEGLQADVVRKLKKERGEVTNWIKDGEFTVISHQGILKLGFKPEEINGAVKDLNDALWKEDKGTKRKGETVKDKMEGIVGNAQKFVTDVMISDLGIDHVSVDEVHNFRKIFQGAKPENVDEEGNAVGAKRYGNVIGGTPSKRAQQLFLISQYIQKRNNNRNVFLASATPVENHATEVYNILSLMARDRMEKMGLLNINDFFSVFANFEVELDQSMTGEPINREKMKSFANVQALQALVKEFIDFQQDPTLVRPERKVITPQLQMSDLQEQNLQKIQELLTGVKTIIDDSAAFTEDSKTMYDVSSEGAEDGAFLKASTYSIANSVSPYFIKEFAGIPPSTKALVEASPKIVYTLNALKELKKDPKTKDFGSFVFFGKMGVEYHPAIAKYFEEELGYNAGEVAYISGSSVTEEEKERIKEDFNSGKVKVLIGGDQTKEGIDLQQNGFMTFNLALGWNPTQIAQVEGRVWRQGNKRSIAPLVYPLVENSGDAMIYNKFEEKGGRINDLFSYAGNVFDVGEVDPAEKKLALITDPVFKAKMQVEIDKTAFYNERVMLDNDMKALQKLRGDLTQSKQSIPDYEENMAKSWVSDEKKAEYKKLIKNAKDRVVRLEQKLKDKGITDINVAIGEIEGKMLDIDNQIKDIQKTEQPLIVKFTKEYNENIAKRKTMTQHMDEIKGLIGELVERTAAEIDAIRKQKIADLEALTRQAIPEFQRVEDRPEEVSKLQELHDKGMILLIDQRSGAITGEQFDKEWEKLAKEYNDLTAPQFQVKQENVTLKTLEKLTDKKAVSKQYIQDLTNSGEIKQAEREAVRDVLKDYKDSENVYVAEFVEKVKATLLPLQVEWEASGSDNAQYENITLPSETRGNVADYLERAYGSPVETKGGRVHGFDIDNYFAHTRIEDMGDSATRRVIEVQSDLFQKGRLAEEQFGMSDGDFFEEQETLEQFLDFVSKEKGITYAEADEMYSNGDIDMTPEDEMGGKFIDFSNEKRAKELQPLLPYKNTWWERIIKEEVQNAAQTKMTKLQFPTGETALAIEGLSRNTTWVSTNQDGGNFWLTPNNLTVGMEANNGWDAGNWVVTDVLGDGKFKAMPKEHLDSAYGEGTGHNFENYADMIIYAEHHATKNFWGSQEQFDVSGKVDKENPIYKFYEKDVQRYLKNRYNAKQVTDAQGITWVEVTLTPEMAKTPIEAFQRVTPSDEPMTTFADAKKRLLEYQKRLGVKFDVDFADVILTGEMGKNMPVTAYGVTYNNKITLIENIKQTTADHELVHIVVNNIEKIDAFKGITREALLTAQNGGKEVSEKDINRLNEELAIGFQLHILEQDQSNVPMIVRRFYQKLQLLLTDFFKALGGDVNVIQDFYRRLQVAESKQQVTFATQEYLDRKARYQWKDKQVMDFSFDTMKEMDDIRRKQFQRIEELAKEYSTDFKRKDINFLENLVATSRDLYLKDTKEFAQADAFMKIGDTRRMKKEILDQKFSDIMSPYFDLKKGEQTLVNEALMQGDELGKDFDSTELEKKGLTESQIAGYFAIRRGFNVAHKLLIAEMENAGVKQEEIETFEKTRKGYMPHKWAYRYAIKTQYLGEGLDPTQNNNWKTDSMDVYKTEREANKVFEQLKKDNKSPETTRYINDTLDSLDVDFFSEQRFSLENMKSVIAKAKTGQDVKDQMVNAMRDIVKEKGFGRHFIKRTGIKGYETKEVPAIIANYFTGLDGFLTKMEAGKAYYGVLEKVDARRQKKFYAWLRDSIAYDMGNTVELDWVKKTAFVYALANDMSFLLTNATQNWTVGVGELTKLYDNKLSKVAGAEAQLMKATSDWAFGNISPEEKIVIEGLVKVGRLGGEMTSELMGFKNNPMYRTMGSWVNTAIYKSTAFVEQNVNRVPAFLAARRILKAKGLSDKEANEQALLVSDDINFRGGKQHRPVFMRGKLGVAFVFNTYIRSFLYQLSRDVKEKQFIALSKKMFYTTLLGGVSALPFAKAIMSIVKALLPPDPEDETLLELRTWEMALQKGVINAWANIDVSSRVNINLFGVDNIIKDPLNVLSWLGAVGGLGKRVWDGKTLYTQERYLEAFGKLFPDFLGNPLKAYNGAVYGVTTLAGNPLIDENGKEFKYTTYEGWVKAFGYTPARESLAWEEMNKKWVSKTEQSEKSAVVQGKIKRQIREGDIEGAKVTQQEALASGDLTKNSTDNVKSALTDKTMQESYTKWNTGVKSRPVLDAIERNIAKEIYGDNYTKLQLTNVTREFAFYRTFGFDDKVANEVKDARTTEDKVIALNKAREEMGLEPFKVFFNKGRTVVVYEPTSKGGENTGYVLISDAVRKAYFSQTNK